eukprot:jgi/Hompol1/2403/HPOL_005986-RA
MPAMHSASPPHQPAECLVPDPPSASPAKPATPRSEAAFDHHAITISNASANSNSNAIAIAPHHHGDLDRSDRSDSSTPLDPNTLSVDDASGDQASDDALDEGYDDSGFDADADGRDSITQLLNLSSDGAANLDADAHCFPQPARAGSSSRSSSLINTVVKCQLEHKRIALFPRPNRYHGSACCTYCH